MRLLLDNNLSIRLAPLLAEHDHDVEHIRALGLAAATDTDVLVAARRFRRGQATGGR